MKFENKLSLVAIAGNILVSTFIYRKTKEVEYYTKNLDKDVKRLEVHISDISESLNKAKLELESSNNQIISSLENIYGTATKRKSNNYRNYNK